MTPDEWQRFHEFEDYLRWRETFQLTPPSGAAQPAPEPTPEHRSFRLTPSCGAKLGRTELIKRFGESLGTFGWETIKLILITIMAIPFVMMAAAALYCMLMGRGSVH